LNNSDICRDFFFFNKKIRREVKSMENISRRAILGITKTLVGSIINKIPIQQQIVQKLSEILNVQRCVIFKLSDDGVSDDIEITAGVPIEEHGIGLRESICKHPDIQEAIRRRKIMVITDPKDSPFTAQFKQVIDQKSIAQILYLPLISELNGKTIGVIVIDAVGEKSGFEYEEIEFCTEVGELISLIIDREEILVEQMRDLIINKIVALGGFAVRLNRLTKEFALDAQAIMDEIKKIEKLCPKGGKINF